MANTEVTNLLTHPAVAIATDAYARLADMALNDPRTPIIADRLADLLMDHLTELETYEHRRQASRAAHTIPRLDITPETLAAFSALTAWTRTIIDELRDTRIEEVFASMKALTAGDHELRP